MRIQSVTARQIFDSRGIPTVEAKVILEDGTAGVGSAPSGASKGSHEAAELRDGAAAYGGKGVGKAVENVCGEIDRALTGMEADQQAALDARMIEIDGSGDKSRLGANAVIAVSWAAANAAAKARGIELFRHLGGVQAAELPCPMFNLINGGRHADNNLEIQEFMLVPAGAESFHEAMRVAVECRTALGKILRDDGYSTAVGDEGGFAPNLGSDAEALDLLMRATAKAGYHPGVDVRFALDLAAGEWYADGTYTQPKTGRAFDRDTLIEYVSRLAREYPLISVEDPLDEEDFEGFALLTERHSGEMMIVGDDLFTTNPDRLIRGTAIGAANAILIKPNQIGTVTETLETVRLARKFGYDVVISHRSGETLSADIADLAVAVNAEYIKAGAPSRGERMAKYNRLLEIEEML